MELGFSKQYNTETLKGFVLYSYKEWFEIRVFFNA